MGFLKKLFGGGEPSGGGDKGLYVYVKLDRSDEIVRLRLNPGSELNPMDEGSGYLSRKLIVGPRSFKRAEAVFYFNENRQMVDSEIQGGELTSAEAWQAYEASKATPPAQSS